MGSCSVKPNSIGRIAESESARQRVSEPARDSEPRAAVGLRIFVPG